MDNKRKEYYKKYYQMTRAAQLERVGKWRKAHPERLKEYRKKWSKHETSVPNHPRCFSCKSLVEETVKYCSWCITHNYAKP